MNAASMLLGASLVICGVLASALADRIRGLKIARSFSAHGPSSTASKDARVSKTTATLGEDQQHGHFVQTDAHKKLQKDVIGALVQSGFAPTEAVTAARACKGSEQSTLEAWTRAALRKLSPA